MTKRLTSSCEANLILIFLCLASLFEKVLLVFQLLASQLRFGLRAPLAQFMSLCSFSTTLHYTISTTNINKLCLFRNAQVSPSTSQVQKCAHVYLYTAPSCTCCMSLQAPLQLFYLSTDLINCHTMYYSSKCRFNHTIVLNIQNESGVATMIPPAPTDHPPQASYDGWLSLYLLLCTLQLLWAPQEVKITRNMLHLP